MVGLYLRQQNEETLGTSDFGNMSKNSWDKTLGIRYSCAGYSLCIVAIKLSGK